MSSFGLHVVAEGGTEWPARIAPAFLNIIMQDYHGTCTCKTALHANIPTSASLASLTSTRVDGMPAEPRSSPPAPPLRFPPTPKTRARSIPRPFTLVGCLCLLALLAMFAAQRHRESGNHLLAAQQELTHERARIQDLQRQLRQCRAKRRPGSMAPSLSLNPAPGGALSNASLGAGLEYVSEATLAAAELVQAEMHAGLAAESLGWCVCPPPPNYTRVCSALSPPADADAAGARLEAQQQRSEAERLRGLVAREKLRLLRSDELLAIARAELTGGAPPGGACGGKRRGVAKGREPAQALRHGHRTLARNSPPCGRLPHPLAQGGLL